MKMRINSLSLLTDPRLHTILGVSTFSHCSPIYSHITMKDPKVHYMMKNGYHACDLDYWRSPTFTMSDDLQEVTCLACLRTVAAAKYPGGRTPTGSAPKVGLSLRIAPHLKQAGEEANLNFSGLLEQAITHRLPETSSAIRSANKVRLSVRIDPDLKTKATAAGVNFSRLLETAIARQLYIEDF